ncbi:MAG TPA: hypothetical protein VNT27_09740 [Propionibacteriaceae bacterium]|nr:hypothetical protein [Propionibacteriaceae bacterium]
MPDDIERFVRKQGKPALLSEHAALSQYSRTTLDLRRGGVD